MEQNRHSRYRIVILASGSGTNAERIIQHFAGSDLAEVVLVLTNNQDAQVRIRAKKAGVEEEVLSRKTYGDGKELCQRLELAKTDFIVLAGYLKLIPLAVIKQYENAIVNIHPALLPEYGGKGMYGMRVHEAVILNKEPESGISIHYVNENYDEGELILQEKVKVEKGWKAGDLAQAIHQLEYQYFPKAIEKVLREKKIEKIFRAN